MTTILTFDANGPKVIDSETKKRVNTRPVNFLTFRDGKASAVTSEGQRLKNRANSLGFDDQGKPFILDPEDTAEDPTEIEDLKRELRNALARENRAKESLARLENANKERDADNSDSSE